LTETSAVPGVVPLPLADNQGAPGPGAATKETGVSEVIPTKIGSGVEEVVAEKEKAAGFAESDGWVVMFKFTETTCEPAPEPGELSTIEPRYSPAEREPGLTVTVNTAGVVVELPVTVSQLPPVAWAVTGIAVPSLLTTVIWRLGGAAAPD
jgi:hypothetical protein